MNKPIILFTNFWDANKLLDRGSYFYKAENKILKVNIIPDHCKIFSIALSHPKIEKLPSIKRDFSDIDRLDMFCPTYDMIDCYKSGGEWSDYVGRFKGIMKQRGHDISRWVKSLMPNNVYILCCWENTSEDMHCHRELLYKALLNSETLKNKAIFHYRNGCCNDMADPKNNKIIPSSYYFDNEHTIHAPMQYTINTSDMNIDSILYGEKPETETIDGEEYDSINDFIDSIFETPSCPVSHGISTSNGMISVQKITLDTLYTGIESLTKNYIGEDSISDEDLPF
jgi:hypothetical protein